MPGQTKKEAPQTGHASFYILILLVGLIHLLGGWYPATLWGTHHAAFLPLPIQILLYLTLPLLAIPSLNRALTRTLASLAAPFKRLPLPLLALALAAAGTLLFATFQIQHRIFGDILMRIGELEAPSPPEGPWYARHTHDTWMRYHLHHRLLAPRGFTPAQSHAGISIAFGGLFLLAAFGLARRICPAPAGTVLLFGGLASSGYILNFFGYPEIYSSVLTAGLCFLWATLAYAHRTCRLWLPLLLLAPIAFFHLLGLFVAPALLAAAIHRHRLHPHLPLSLRSRWVPLLIGLSLLGGWAAFQVVRPTSAIPLVHRATHIPYRVFSPAHLAEMLNEHLLVALPGWMALLLGGFASGQPGAKDRITRDVLGAGAIPSVGMMGLVNPALGRMDWDLMSLPGPAWVAFGGAFFLSRCAGASRRAEAACVVLVLSLFHTLPWIGLQRHPARAVASIEAMVQNDPHNYGRRGGILGTRLLREGFEQAGRRQLERIAQMEASRADPITMRSLCHLYMEENRYDDVEALLSSILRIVPDQASLQFLRHFRRTAPDGNRRTVRILEEIIQTNPHPTYFGILTEFYREENRTEDLTRLVHHLDRTIAREEARATAFPQSGEAHLRLGALYLRRGRVAEAEHTLNKAASLGLDDPQQQAAADLLQIIHTLKTRK